MPTFNDNILWQARAYIYEYFAQTARPPALAEVAARFQLAPAAAEALFDELNRRHAFFLEPGTYAIRIANPFSAVPTGFPVRARGQTYWANCAWDSLGIPAALQCDAVIETTCAATETPLTLTVHTGAVTAPPGTVAHFLVPFSNWYADMVFT
jgi:hypothetical protein